MIIFIIITITNVDRNTNSYNNLTLSSFTDACDVSMCQYGGHCQLDEEGDQDCICNFSCSDVNV